MSPRSLLRAPSPPAIRAASRMAMVAGQLVRAARTHRRWALATLAEKAGMSDSHVAQIEAGASASLEAYARLFVALDLEPVLTGVDPRRRSGQSRDVEDFVHAAMGELEASRLSGFGHVVAIDEPYQHYQFAGRADVVAWDLDARALLHFENRTGFPNVQEALGSYASKRAYLGGVLAQRLGLRAGWRSETHVIAALWSSEVLHSLRLREATFRAACPDGIEPVQEWWSGIVPPREGATSSLVLFDPAPGVRPAFRIGEIGPATRPRHRGYADASDALRGQVGAFVGRRLRGL